VSDARCRAGRCAGYSLSKALGILLCRAKGLYSAEPSCKPLMTASLKVGQMKASLRKGSTNACIEYLHHIIEGWVVGLGHVPRDVRVSVG
jgi:hypothetical protein